MIRESQPPPSPTLPCWGESSQITSTCGAQDSNQRERWRERLVGPPEAYFLIVVGPQGDQRVQHQEGCQQPQADSPGLTRPARQAPQASGRRREEGADADEENGRSGAR